MKILFAFENSLPSDEADAEVFLATAQHLAPLVAQSWLHVPAGGAAPDGLSVIRACAPARPAALRHFCCGLTLVFRRAFRQADLVYTRNLWVAWMTVLFGQHVVFDHYRPWPDQIPPLQPWIRALMGNRRFLVNICHSDYTREKYLALGIDAAKLLCVRNGFAPQRLQPWRAVESAKRSIGVSPECKTVIYTGRVNHKKGLALVIEVARRMPELTFILVGSYGSGPIEAMAKDCNNIRIVPWQKPEVLARYIYAADVLLIPPSLLPMARFGSTVLPLKLFLYMASGRPILAGDTADVREVLRHGENAFLCRPDRPDALVEGLRALTGDAELAARLGKAAQADSRELTWDARASRIRAIVANRRGSIHGKSVAWSGPRFRTWLGESRRWLQHLIREKSWVLPTKIPEES